MTAFSRFDPVIREYIYEQRWKRIRPMQEAAAAAIFGGKGHILIAAATASGKTEACFFPVITLLRERAAAKKERALAAAFSPPGNTAEPAASVDVLYAGPLKALINDQFRRLEDILERAEIPLWRWHGDISGGLKNKLLENPSGILQITPESLEALLLRRPEKIRSLFRRLSFIIIDEVHAFMGSDRGFQLLCQMGRIGELAGCSPRRIGLSATLGDYGEALRWLGMGTAGESILVRGDEPAAPPPGAGTQTLGGESRRRISLLVDYFYRPLPQDDTGQGDGKAPENAGTGEPGRAYYRDLYRQCRFGGEGTEKGKGRGNCIIFTNSRLEAEETIARLREEAARRREGDIFHVHHGNVSRMLRMEAERDLREEEEGRVAAATATLELGIDLGRLDRIIQIGPPLTAAGFVQRLGRSGRRSGVPEMYFTALEEPRRARNLIDAIPWDLLKTIAVIQLYLEEKWIEGAPRRPLPFSLLCHQTLSILASLGEQPPEDLARRVLALPPFTRIAADDFKELIRHLTAGGYIQITGEGSLLLGLEGEGIVNNFGFYGVFPGEETYRVMAGERELGTVHFLPAGGSSLVLAGRYWQVETVDFLRREIYVVPGKAGTERIWRGGGADMHRRIAERMKRVLTEDEDYPYLSKQARRRLTEARSYAARRGDLDAGCIPGEDGILLLPWLGSRGMRTLTALLQNREYRKALGIFSCCREQELIFHIRSELDLPGFKGTLRKLILGLDSPESLLEPGKIPLTDKYDYLLPQGLLLKQYAANMLDLDELKTSMDLFRNPVGF
ncbi:MAG: DEAD/DEAH box helicase [Treponema sp.]|jgi:ATP-dependent Lhr-like helicase|nr:DEAD/DEAH box helicase [Treponema sp.]